MVACGKNRDERHTTEIEREVPRHDDPDNPPRLRRYNVTCQAKGRAINRTLLHPHPAPQMHQGMLYLFENGENFGNERLVPRAVAIILRDRRTDLLSMVEDKPPKGLKPAATRGKRGVRLLEEGLLLIRQQASDQPFFAQAEHHPLPATCLPGKMAQPAAAAVAAP